MHVKYFSDAKTFRFYLLWRIVAFRTNAVFLCLRLVLCFAMCRFTQRISLQDQTECFRFFSKLRKKVGPNFVGESATGLLIINFFSVMESKSKLGSYFLLHLNFVNSVILSVLIFNITLIIFSAAFLLLIPFFNFHSE